MGNLTYFLATGLSMLLAIVVAAVLVIYYKCGWRHRFRIFERMRRRRPGVGNEHLVDMTLPEGYIHPGGEGLDKSVINLLPTFEFKESKSYLNGDSQCPVCLEEFVNGEKGRCLPACRHGFHVDCIDLWLLSHTTCPLCRSDINLESLKSLSCDSSSSLAREKEDEQASPVYVIVTIT